MTTYCREHDEDVTLCPPCAGAGAPRRLSDHAWGRAIDRAADPDRVFEARFDGPCLADCGERIQPGELIVHAVTDGAVVHAGYVHEACLLA